MNNYRQNTIQMTHIFPLKSITLIMLFLLIFLCTTKAQTISFVAGTDVGTQTDAGKGSDEVSKDGITLSVTKGAFASPQYRVAKGQTLTIASTVGNIEKIVFTCSASNESSYGPGCFEAQDGYSYLDRIGTWEGLAESVSFVASKAQVRFTTLEVTVSNPDPSFVAIPIIVPSTGTYYSHQTVTITSSTDAIIYYTTDGSTPTAESDIYLAPFDVSETTIIKAIAEKNGNISNISESILTFETPNSATINEILSNQLTSATTQATVVATCNKGIVISDGTGFMYVYQDKETEFSVGDDVIISGPTTLYGGCLQFNQQTNIEKIGTAEVTYPQPLETNGVSIDNLCSDPVLTYIEFSGIATDIKNNYYNMTIDGSNTIVALRPTAQMASLITSGNSYKVTGFFLYSYDNTTKYAYIAPTNIEVINSDSSDDSGKKTIAELHEMVTVTPSQQCQLNANGLYVLGISGRNAYLTDGNKGILLMISNYNTTTITAGDVLSGVITGTLQKYRGAVEINLAMLNDATVVSHNNSIAPRDITTEQFANNYSDFQSMLVRVSDVYVSKDTLGAFSFEDKHNSINGKMFDYYSVGLNDYSFDDQKSYILTGILGLYGDTDNSNIVPELYPRSISDIEVNDSSLTLYPFNGKWNVPSVSATIGEAINATFTTDSNAPITYSSSDENVAIVSEDGIITAIGIGNALITASQPSNDLYRGGNANLVIVVKTNTEPVDTKNATIITWNPSVQGYTNGQSMDIENFIPLDENVSIKFDKGDTSNTPRYYTSDEAVRLYCNNSLTINGKKDILKIEMKVSAYNLAVDSLKCDKGFVDYSNGWTWQGKSQSVKLYVDGTRGHIKIESMTIYYAHGKYSIIYLVDNEVLLQDSIMPDSIVPVVQEPTREGYTFSGWSEIPQTMPAVDVTITGSFLINTYLVTYMMDGEVWRTDSVTFGQGIPMPEVPARYGYVFNNWTDMPTNGLMPAHDVTVTAYYSPSEIETDDSKYVYSDEAEGYEYVSTVSEESTEVVIPQEVEGIPVTIIPEGAFADQPQVQVVTWENPAPVENTYFAAPEEHGNLLVFVASDTARVTYEGNVVRNGIAEKVTLYDGRPMTNPRQFMAEHISITKEFSKETIIGSTSGWETIVVPFDVDSITTEDGQLIAPFGSEALTDKHFWLAKMDATDGFLKVSQIRANVPYIISMPNNERYTEEYRISGKVTFHGTNVEVQPTANATSNAGPLFGLVPTYQEVAAADSVFVLNDEPYEADGVTWPAGSVFVRSSRAARPFEAYTYANASNGGNVKGYIRLDEKATGLQQILNAECTMHNAAGAVYDLSGRRIAGSGSLKKGLYIESGQKVLVK